MVGVPGRSKGCHTCRRRKIKCDLAKPNCDRCVRSGRECEGYARGAVFLNRTPQGMLKREHLDEAKPRNQTQSSPALNFVEDIESFPSKNQRSPSPTFDVYASVDDRKVLTAGLESYYVSRFVPLESRRGTDTCGVWSMKALGMANRGEALDNAFAALAFNRAGRDQDDPSLVLQGQEAYGRSLRAVSRSLLEPRATKSDQLLAACNLLKTYEIQEATGDSTSGHDSHTYGLTRMIQQRGPDVLQSEHNRHLVNEVRFSAMIIALQYRKRSPLGEPQWSTKSWKRASDASQDLYDKGFTLAGLTEDMDSLANEADPDVRQKEAVDITRKILNVHDSLNTWHQELLERSRLPLDWPNANSLPRDRPDELCDNSKKSSSKINFSLLSQRVAMMDFWTLRIGICLVLKTFEQGMAFADSKRMCPQQSLGDMMLHFAENIVETAPLCLSKDCGIYGQSRRTIYALRVAIIPARMISTPRAGEVRKRVEALITIVSSKAARNVAAKSTISEAWKDTVYAEDHQFTTKA